MRGPLGATGRMCARWRRGSGSSRIDDAPTSRSSSVRTSCSRTPRSSWPRPTGGSGKPIDGVARKQGALYRGSIQRTADPAPVALAEFGVGPAERNHPPSTVSDHYLAGARGYSSPAPQAQVADQSKPLRIGELGTVAALVLDHPSP